MRPGALRANQEGPGSGKSVSCCLRVQQQRQQTLIASETPTCCASGGTIYIYIFCLSGFFGFFVFAKIAKF